MAERMMRMTVCRNCESELDLGENGWVDEDGTPYCSLVDEDPHVPVLLIELPEIEELADWMVQLAQKDGFTTTQRFRNSMKGWAKLAHQALSGEKR